ncbi:unnamed protein product [Symbiodinium sp. CCMP2456]|nr:unnamed protein product [Symbiodinium sp. CCMP2456]
MACFNEILTESLCCDCNFFECWTEPYTVDVCCLAQSFASQQSLLFRNSTEMNASTRLCDPIAARACTTKSAFLQDPNCQTMAKYAAGLAASCVAELSRTTCYTGLVIMQWNSYVYGSALTKSQRHRADRSFEECSQVLEEFFHDGYMAMMKRCARTRQRELRDLVPRAAHVLASDALQESRAWVSERPKVGVIMAMSSQEASLYKHTLDIWHCYCARHKDCEVVVEWDNFLPAGQYPYVWLDSEAKTPKRRFGFSWNRWFALQRHLDAFEWVFTADPDQFISHECFLSFSFTDVLRQASAVAPPSDGVLPVVVMRDFPEFQNLHLSCGGPEVRTAQALVEFRYLVTLKESRCLWMDPEDQSSFDHTILEILDLWRNAAASSVLLLEAPLDFLTALTCCGVVVGKGLTNRVRQQAVEGGFLKEPHFGFQDGTPEAVYLECWHVFARGPDGERLGNSLDLVASILGDFGQRKDSLHGLHPAPIRFLSPEEVDINFVIGGRNVSDAPLVWHFAGALKSLIIESGDSYMDVMLKQLWQLDPDWRRPVSERANCSAWESYASRSVSKCSPGTPVVDCRTGWLAVC